MESIEKTDTLKHKHTNKLINQTSPYLLQHAHNPVNWYPWGEEALNKAKSENKLLLISIGYSACHWCHVMERESFEDEEVAKIMNEHFVSIKIDREEHPDIDQIYMNAVQLMTQSGGWPLNCFALPDSRPFFGGTYFPKNQWMQLLEKVNEEYRKYPQKVIEYAQNLTEGIQQSELIKMNTSPSQFLMDNLETMVNPWKKLFDNKEGGPNRAPKFPLPNNYLFLLRYAHINKDDEVMKHVKTTLGKMAYGGIYDQIGGGFARYSTDIYWKVPHFEKMLYDNAQLVGLYSEAYQLTKDPLYKQVVQETLGFINLEMTDITGAFYSAIDADSEGEEGKFYIWNKEELQDILGKDFNLFADYYNVNNSGFWEHDNYILLRTDPDEKIAQKHNLTVEELNKKTDGSKQKVFKARSKRIRPRLDDKMLTSWNSLMLKGYVDAYNVFNKKEYLEAALKNATFIINTMKRSDGGLYHNYKDGRTTINGYMEDYAFTIEAFIALYEATFDEKWLTLSKELAEYAIKHFYDAKSGMFWFTSDLDPPLVARKMEIGDNVIPSSNSAMAKSLHLLGLYFDNNGYTDKSEQMLNNVKQYMPNYGSGYSNWGILMLKMAAPFYEVAITGEEADEKRQQMNEHFLPNKMYIGSAKPSVLPLLQNKFVDKKTMIYICLNKTCKLPVTDVDEALKQIQHE